MWMQAQKDFRIQPDSFLYNGDMIWHRTQLEQNREPCESSEATPSHTRRQVLAYCASSLASLTFVQTNTESRLLDITRHALTVKHLDRPMRIVQLTDIHRSQFVPEAFVEHVVAEANRQNPDLVFLTGDFVTRTSGYAESCMRPLAGLKAKIGKFAVLGNHDYWCDGGNGGPVIHDWLEQTEIEVLTNRSVKLSNGLRLVGIDDLMAGVPNYTLAFEDVKSNEPVVVMSHNPGTFYILCRQQCLTIAGHTHGGQLYVPGVSNLLVGNRFLRGWYRFIEQPGSLYISRGLGTIHVPMRLCAMPELAVFDLTPA